MGGNYHYNCRYVVSNTRHILNMLMFPPSQANSTPKRPIELGWNDLTTSFRISGLRHPIILSSWRSIVVLMVLATTVLWATVAMRGQSINPLQETGIVRNGRTIWESSRRMEG